MMGINDYGKWWFMIIKLICINKSVVNNAEQGLFMIDDDDDDDGW